MTLFINKICNRGPSTLGFSTEIPLEQHGTQDNGYSKYSPPVLSHSWVWTPTERGRFGQYKICPFKKFLSLKQKLSSWAKQVGRCEVEGEQNTPTLQKYLILYEQNSIPALLTSVNLHNLLRFIHAFERNFSSLLNFTLKLFPWRPREFHKTDTHK